MYSYSHEPDGGWLGAYENASQALIAGRAMYGDDIRIYVALWVGGNYSDVFIGAVVLLSYMREEAEVKEVDVAAFDALNDAPESVHELNTAIKDVIGEWEAELADPLQFTGQWIKQTRGYAQGEEVRPGHWPRP